MMSHQRLNLIKQFSAQSAAALQCLDEGDALIPQIDKLTAAIEASLKQLGETGAATLRALFASGMEGASRPQWCATLASDWANMAKLLHCVGMNARMEARAQALSGQLPGQINCIRANQKLRSQYILQGGSASASFPAVYPERADGCRRVRIWGQYSVRINLRTFR